MASLFVKLVRFDLFLVSLGNSKDHLFDHRQFHRLNFSFLSEYIFLSVLFSAVYLQISVYVYLSFVSLSCLFALAGWSFHVFPPGESYFEDFLFSFIHTWVKCIARQELTISKLKEKQTSKFQPNFISKSFSFILSELLNYSIDILCWMYYYIL
jgi:hypothetical protein